MARASRSASSRVTIVVTLLAALLIAVPAGAAQAAPLSLVVDNTAADGPDNSQGDGVCQATSGGCTLRAAIQEANATPGKDGISFPPLSLTHLRDVVDLSLAGAGEDAAQSGDLDITDSLTLTGNGARRTVIGASGAALGDRILDLDPAGSGIEVEITGVTIRDGSVADDGGGIRSKGRLTLTDSVVAQNTAGDHGGGLLVDANAAVAQLDGVVVRDNRARRTGGGLGNRGTLTLTRVTVDGNSADGEAGGLWNGGLATLRGVTLSGNKATGVGGGQFAGAMANGGSASLENVTVSGNVGDPGGIHNGGPLRLTNVTINHNTGGIFNCTACGGTVRAANTIVADSGFIFNINCYGAIVSLGHNLDDGTGCGFTASGDLQNASPVLGPLARSVGRTRTHALLAGSQAPDAGDSALCPATDQRGVRRPQGAACDIGAHEAQRSALWVNSRVDAVDANPGDGICETTVPGQCTLRAAVIEANALPGPDLIRFRIDGRFPLTVPGAGEDTSFTGDLDVTEDVTVVGRGATRTRVGGVGARLADRVLHVHNGAHPGLTVSVSGLTLEQGNLPSGEHGGGVLIGDLLDGTPATLVMRDMVVRDNRLGFLSTGGGLSNNGQLELDDAVVRSNHASLGGGIFAGLDAVSTFSDVTASDNTASDDGGGIYLAVTSTSTISRATAARNAADEDGGGVWNGGALTLSDSTVDHNSGGRWGGGLYNHFDASASVATSSLSANSAQIGGGAYNQSGRLAVDRSTVDHNDASGFGGGGLNNNNGSLTLRNATVSGNTTAFWGGGVRNSVGTVNAQFSTVTGNQASIDGGGIANGTGAFTLRGTILAANLAGNCAGTVTTGGNNLDSGTTCSLAAGELSSSDPLLGPLAANGGPTATHAFLTGSPARDSGGTAGCPPTDQRGISRPQGPACDIGAYEAT